jgi:hypothetical protein
MMRKLDKLAESVEIMADSEGSCAKCYLIPKNWLSIRRPRQMSEKQKEVLRARLKAISKVAQNRF